MTKPTAIRLVIGIAACGIAAYLAYALVGYVFRGSVDWAKPIPSAVIVAIVMPVLAIRQANKQSN